jgi:hypothetical protein
VRIERTGGRGICFKQIQILEWSNFQEKMDGFFRIRKKKVPSCTGRAYRTRKLANLDIPEILSTIVDPISKMGRQESISAGKY